MSFTKFIAAGGAVLLALGASTLGAVAAHADDGAPAPESAVTENAPATTTGSETAPESPPPAEEPPAAPAEPAAEPPAASAEPAAEPPAEPKPVVEDVPEEEEAAPAARSARTTSGAATLAGPNYIETSHVLTANGVDITLRNVSPWIYPTSVKIDGVHSYGPTVDNRTDTDGNGSLDLNGPQKDASKTRSIAFDACSGDHTVSYRVDAGSEMDLYKNLPVGTWTDLSITAPCDYVTVAWLAPGGAPPNHFDVPQIYKFSEKTDVPMLTALDDEIAAYLAAMRCGTEADFQVDVYFDDATTEALIAGGVLNGPSDPPEHLIPGGYGSAW